MDIAKLLNIFKTIVKDISQDARSLDGLKLKEAIEELSKVSSQFTDKEKDALKCIIEANKKLTLAINHVKVVVSDVKMVTRTSERMLHVNIAARSIDFIECDWVINVFKMEMNFFLPKLMNARDGLLAAISELQENVVKQLDIIKSWCLEKRLELGNEVRDITRRILMGSSMSIGGVVAIALFGPLILLPPLAVTFVDLFYGNADRINIMQPLRNMYNGVIERLEESAEKCQAKIDDNAKICMLEATIDANAKKSNLSDFDLLISIKKDMEELESLCYDYLEK